MKRFLSVTITLALILLAPLVSLAADESVVGVSITPLKYDLSANPGQTLHQVVTAVNPNDFPLKVVPEFQDFRVLEDAGIQWIPSDVENPYRMTDWIHISQEPITLAPKQQTDVPFTIEVPKNASVGGHYAAIFFRAVLDNKGTIGSIPRVGALIIFNVNGSVSKTGEISSFTSSRFVDHGPVNFSLSLKNTGTTHYIPKTSLTIRNMFGFKSTIQGESNKFIYPGVSRVINAKWDKSFPLGLYFVKATFTDGNGVDHTQSLWFIGFPWKYFLTIFVALVALRYIIKFAKKKFKIVRV